MPESAKQTTLRFPRREQAELPPAPAKTSKLPANAQKCPCRLRFRYCLPLSFRAPQTARYLRRQPQEPFWFPLQPQELPNRIVLAPFATLRVKSAKAHTTPLLQPQELRPLPLQPQPQPLLSALRSSLSARRSAAAQPQPPLLPETEAFSHSFLISSAAAAAQPPLLSHAIFPTVPFINLRCLSPDIRAAVKRLPSFGQICSGRQPASGHFHCMP